MPLVSKSFSIDIVPGKTPPTIHVSEKDIGRLYYISIVDDGTPFSIPSGTTAKVEGTIGPYGFSENADVINNTIIVTLRSKMTAIKGKVWTKIKLSNNGDIASTCAFWLDVDEAGAVEGRYIDPDAPPDPGGGGVSLEGFVQYNEPQALSESEKAQARANIGASEVGDVLPSITAQDNGKVLGVVNGEWTIKEDEGEDNVQTDWDQDDNTKADYLKHKPGVIRYDQTQSLSEGQKSQARSNLGITEAVDKFNVFFGVNPNSANVRVVNSNNVAVTGQNIKDRIISSAGGCVLVVTDNEDANHFLIYDLDEYTSTGAVVFYRIVDGYRHTITVPIDSNVGTKAKEPLVDSEGGDPAQIDAVLYTTQNLTDSQKRIARRNIGLNGYAIGLYHKLYSGSATSGALYAIQADGTVSSTPLTFSDIWKAYYNNDKCFIFAYDENNNVYKLKHIGDGTIVLHYVDGGTEYLITMALVSGETPSTAQNVSANKSSVSSGSATNEIYYVDGTTVKSDADNAVRTGQQILNETIANGIVPVVRVHNSTAQKDEIFHYYVSHSGGIEFLTLDGTKKLTINWSGSTATITEVSISGDPFMIYAVWDSSQNKYVLKKSSSLSGENVTFSELFSNRFNLWLNRSLHVNGIFYSDGYNEYHFTQDEIDSTENTVSTVEWIVRAGSSTGVTVERLSHTSGDDSSNVYYYIDGTNIKNAKTNLAVTGQDIYNQTIAQGLAPVLYESNVGYFETIQYHFYRYGSFGMYFRRLDGAFEVSVSWNNSTFIKTEGGYNTPFRISAVWNSSQNKYILRALVDGSWVTASFNDIYNHAEGLLLNTNLPVDKIYRSPPSWISAYFYDIQPTSSGFSIIEWYIEADISNTITVTRNVIENIQRTAYYAVTLNANGTINTKDSSLSWSTVSGRMPNPAFADYLLVTWGNSLFTAKAVEKLSNDDIKFIGNVEHDGIQRYMVFTLGSDDTLTTTVIETYSRRPVVVWEVQDATQGLSALNTNISSSMAWQLTNLDLTPFKRIKIYSRAGRKTGATAADSSITPASIIEMSLDDRAKETVSQNVFIGSSIVQNPNDSNRLGLLTCAVSGDKTKFAVVRSTTLYGTAATSNTDAYTYVFKIEGYYD